MCTKCVVSQLVDGVLVLSVHFPSCGWGVGTKCAFPIMWMGCGTTCVVSHLMDGVLVCVSNLVDGV